MYVPYFLCDLSLPLLYVDYIRVETWWNYQNVISPFYRLYLINKGKGAVYVNHRRYELLPGQLFLIPKFAFHSYECEDFMEHYYICFFDETSGGRSITNPMKMNLQIEATSIDYLLMERFLTLNPYKSLPTVDPQYYDNDKNIYKQQNNGSSSTFSTLVESNGILLQLFSRFITEESLMSSKTNSLYGKLDEITQYINKHLDRRITVAALADMMCVTSDHFSKIFKRIMGIPPCEYIQMKRIERAQMLLLSSHMSIAEIAEKVGIGNLSQFSRFFSKVVCCSPKEYREKQFNMMVAKHVGLR